MLTGADLETTLLGPVLPNRSCGECTACCTVLKVDSPDFSKSEGTPCAHLRPGGCGIHPVRPEICRTWFCAWRRVEALPEMARPDRSGLLVSLSFNRAPRNCLEGVFINVRMLAGSNAIEDGTAAVVLDTMCERLVPVWFSDGSEKMLMHPDRDVAGYITSGTPAPAHLRDEVRLWRERYRSFAPARQ